MGELLWLPIYVDRLMADRNVQFMDAAMFGAYMAWLFSEWSDGPLPDDITKLCKIGKDIDESKAKALLKLCFTNTENGWINERLESIRIEQIDRHEKRVSAGKSGAKAKAYNKKRKPSNAKAMLKQCSSKESNTKHKNKQYVPVARRLSEIIALKTATNPVSESTVDSWSNDIRLSVEQDGTTIERINAAIDHIEAHFGEQYCPVVQSGKALREKMVKIEAAIKRSGEIKKQTLQRRITFNMEQQAQQELGPYATPEQLQARIDELSEIDRAEREAKLNAN